MFNLVLSQHFLVLQMPFSAITELYFTNRRKEFCGDKVKYVYFGLGFFFFVSIPGGFTAEGL